MVGSVAARADASRDAGRGERGRVEVWGQGCAVPPGGAAEGAEEGPDRTLREDGLPLATGEAAVPEMGVLDL